MRFIYLFFLLSVFVQAQQVTPADRLEQRIIALKSFVTKEIFSLKKQIKKRDRKIQELEDVNNTLQKNMQELLKQQKELQTELLRIRVELTKMKKGETITEISNPQETPTEVVENTKNMQFEDPQVNELANSLSSKESNIRLGALLKLRNIDNEESSKAIMLGLKDRDPYVIIMAIKILAKRKARIAENEIASLLGDKNQHVRKEAQEALLEIRTE